jgi:peptide/nickel transport system permease protein
VRARSRGSRFAVLMALALSASALLADFLSPNPPEEQDLVRAFAPPARVHFRDGAGGYHLRPFVYALELDDALALRYREQQENGFPLRFLVEGYPYRLLGFIPARLHLVGADNERLLILGADELGRDVFARTLQGARTSLAVVAVGLLACALVGLLVGSAAGAAGPVADSALMRLAEFVMALPGLYVVLALRAALPARPGPAAAVLLTAGIISSVSWPPLARGVRGLMLRLRASGYVEASRAIGTSGWRIFLRHHAPSLLPFVLTQSLLVAPVFLLGEVVLSFLDAGLGETVSWGSMLRTVRDPRILTDYPWNLAPLLLVFMTLACINLLARDLPAGPGRTGAPISGVPGAGTFESAPRIS